jgi:hypothetical protein
MYQGRGGGWRVKGVIGDGKYRQREGGGGMGVERGRGMRDEG